VRVVVKPVYAYVVLDGIPLASVEEVVMLKTKLWRERDIIDVCLIILDSFDSMEMKKLKEKLRARQFHEGFIASLKRLLDLQGIKRGGEDPSANAKLHSERALLSNARIFLGKASICSEDNLPSPAEEQASLHPS